LSELKYCHYCKESKSLSQFYQRRGKIGGSSYCKPCTNAESLMRQRKFKTKCIEYKGGKCEICGYNKFQGALEFHHRDPTQKDFQLSKARSWTFNERVKNELDKCQILCSNCHKELHNELDKDKGYERK
jgi:predicted HNH restriction endonuclease